MNISDIVRLRLYNQHISSAKFKTVSEVVSWLGAIQAQDYPGAKWSIGLRLKNSRDADIEKAIADRKIIRTWPMRGTLHFIAAEDARWMLNLLTPRIIAGTATRQKNLNLNSEIFDACKKLFIKVMAGGKRFTRREMIALLESKDISTANQRGYHILGRLAQEGVICFGPMRNKQQTFVLLNDWLPKTKALERNEALAELTRRYFTSHGPATIQDFAWWSGLKIVDIKSGIKMAGNYLKMEKIDGREYWMSSDISSEAMNKEFEQSAVYMLPGFDEYLLGYKDRSAVLDLKHAQKITPGSNGMFTPTILINGRVVGIWKKNIKKNVVIIRPDFFVKTGRKEILELTFVAERYGYFIGLPAVLDEVGK